MDKRKLAEFLAAAQAAELITATDSRAIRVALDVAAVNWTPAAQAMHGMISRMAIETMAGYRLVWPEEWARRDAEARAAQGASQ